LLELDILSEDEEAELMKCEQVIERGLGTVFSVGCAMATIRDNRLHRATHRRWEEYCRDRWGLGKAAINHKINAYEVVSLLESEKGTIVPNCEKKPINESEHKHEYTKPILPKNEAQTRPLSNLTPAQQVDAWILVQEWVNGGAKLTSYLVGKAAKRVKGASVKEVVAKTKKDITAPSSLVSKLFLKQIKVLTEIIEGEYNSGWRTTSKKEVVSRLKDLLKAVDEMV
jgi:hypothetical protein